MKENLEANQYANLSDKKKNSSNSAMIGDVKNYISKLEKEIEQHEKKQKDKDLNKSKLSSAISLLKKNNDDSSSLAFENLDEEYLKWKDQKSIEFEVIEQNLLDITHKLKATFIEKEHIYRESLLSIIFNNDPNTKPIYDITLCIFIWILLWIVAKNYNENGSFIELSYFTEKINFLITILILIIIYSYGLLTVIFIQFIKNKSILPYKIIFTTFFIYWIFPYFSVSYYIFTNASNIPIVSSIIIGCELVRSSLKEYAYFRDKLLYGFPQQHKLYIEFKPKNVEETPIPPNITISTFNIEINRFFYFFFCPSLIYRDSYPRLKQIRWFYVFIHLFNFIMCILYFYCLMNYSVEPFMKNYVIPKNFSLIEFIYDSLTLAIPGTMFLLVGFFMFLHSFLNMFSELLTFGDRRFYEDWWCCTNFEEYYRKWNMVVHEWLYYYIYNDVLRFSLGKLNKHHAKVTVFLVSIVVHELIVTYLLKFFYPVLSLFFGGPGIIFTYIKTKDKKFNVIFWFKLYLGIGLIFALLLREFKARELFVGVELISQVHYITPKSYLIYLDYYSDLLK